MYCIRKFADCWAIFNLDNDLSRSLSQDEMQKISQEIPALTDPQIRSYFSDDVDCLEDKP